MRYTSSARTCALLIIWTVVFAFGSANRSPAQTDSEAIKQAKGLSQAFRAAAKRVLPTVVKVRTSARARKVKGRPRSKNPFEGTPLEEFFGEDDLRGFRGYPFIPRRDGVGSGVIINPTGIILTNNHVVEDADEVIVELADGRRFPAVEVKVDKQTDLAVLRIQAEGPLPAARLGDSEKVDIGDWVIAVGSPFELEQTVSAGIISGKGRSLDQTKRAKFLQTDAAINPGNSGGPLVNLDGEVVGINTAIASRNGGFQGIGFAIPVNLAKWVTPQLIQRGSVRRAYLGVSIGKIESEVARLLGVRPNQGVVVSEVYPKTPAAEAGIEEGDVIVSFAGRAVHNPRELQEVVERSKLGSKQKAQIIREGRTSAVAVVVESLPEKVALAARPSASRGEKETFSAYEDRELGIELVELTGTTARQLGYAGYSGVLVGEVKPEGTAFASGLRPGLLIRRVGRKWVKSIEEFKAAMQAQSVQKGVLLLVRVPTAGGAQAFMVLRSSPSAVK